MLKTAKAWYHKRIMFKQMRHTDACLIKMMHALNERMIFRIKLGDNVDDVQLIFKRAGDDMRSVIVKHNDALTTLASKQG